jgi:hypothetical protein
LQGRTLAYCKPRRPSAFGFNLLHTRKLQRADWRASLTYRSGKNGTKRVLTGTLGKPRHGWRRRVGGGFWRGGARRPSSFLSPVSRDAWSKKARSGQLAPARYITPTFFVGGTSKNMSPATKPGSVF